MYTVNLPSIPEIRVRQPKATDSFVLADVADLPDLIRKHVQGHYREMALDTLAGKNTELTTMAEKYVHQFEEDVFSGRGWETRDNVVGSFPNVPAFLAGVPCTMRQRYRTTRNVAPLTLYVELTGSAGVEGNEFIRRGAAILALCRLLANTRPVELWTTTTYGTTNRLQMVACKVETAPLDVSRGAALLCEQSLRAVGHEINQKELGDYRNMPRNPGCSLGWAYGEPDMERRWAGEILSRILNPGATMFYIPAAHSRDMLADPVKWVRDMLAKYGKGSDDSEDSFGDEDY